MANVTIGCRVLVESETVGVDPRSGVVTDIQGAAIHVRWDDGHESSFIPGPGALRVLGEEPSSS
jgi:hypothetical protein